MVHGFNTKENFGLNQEGGKCVDKFDNLENFQTTIDHDPYGLGRWEYLQLQGKEGSMGRFIKLKTSNMKQ